MGEKLLKFNRIEINGVLLQTGKDPKINKGGVEYKSISASSGEVKTTFQEEDASDVKSTVTIYVHSRQVTMDQIDEWRNDSPNNQILLNPTGGKGEAIIASNMSLTKYPDLGETEIELVFTGDPITT